MMRGFAQFECLNVVDAPNIYAMPPTGDVDTLTKSLAFNMPNIVLINLGFVDNGVSAADKLQAVDDVDLLHRFEEEIVDLRRGILVRQHNYEELIQLFKGTAADDSKLRAWCLLCDMPVLRSDSDAFRDIALSSVATSMRARIVQLEIELTAVRVAAAKLNPGTATVEREILPVVVGDDAIMAVDEMGAAEDDGDRADPGEAGSHISVASSDAERNEATGGSDGDSAGSGDGDDDGSSSDSGGDDDGDA